MAKAAAIKLVEIGSMADFNKITKENKDKIIVCDFYATWCGPCKMISPKYKELSQKYGKKLVFCECDVDAAEDFVEHCGVKAMPTFVFFKNGKELSRIKGADVKGLTKAIEGCAK
mmetsp:Transcript_5059/g.6290  ORF Transcript_5059/g.6290 Transcript_5059/m.6290 type:complete len:115 (+) Transcript_5059:37-381(+)